MNSPYRVLSEAYPSPRAVSPGQGSATARVSFEKKVRQVDTLLMLVSRDNAMNSASLNVKISSHKKLWSRNSHHSKKSRTISVAHRSLFAFASKPGKRTGTPSTPWTPRSLW